MEWDNPPRPAELAENRLITAILDQNFPIDSNLPAERELAGMLGVTRPTLREVLQRLARDGWIEIRHGKPTRVRDYWKEGSLAVLGSLARHSSSVGPQFITHLLVVRQALAPDYTTMAIRNAAEEVATFLAGVSNLPDTPQAFSSIDWELHHLLTVKSGNPVYTLILNGFLGLYQAIGLKYFDRQEARAVSRVYYQDLHRAALDRDSDRAREITWKVMKDSIDLWESNL